MCYSIPYEKVRLEVKTEIRRITSQSERSLVYRIHLEGTKAQSTGVFAYPYSKRLLPTLSAIPPSVAEILSAPRLT